MMNEKELRERIDRLEKLYGGLYHTMELLSIYIPKLIDILVKYFGASQKLRYEIFGDFNSVQSVLRNILDDLQVHYKSHNELFEKKKSKQYKYDK